MHEAPKGHDEDFVQLKQKVFLSWVSRAFLLLAFGVMDATGFPAVVNSAVHLWARWPWLPHQKQQVERTCLIGDEDCLCIAK